MERIVNQIARMIIGLHEEGYHDDFELFGKDQVLRVQGYIPYAFTEININKTYKLLGRGRKGEKFIYAIETIDGFKGLLISIKLEQDFNESPGKSVKTKPQKTAIPVDLHMKS